MNAFYEHHHDSIRFGYRCFDRILLNGLIQPFQQPERVIGFFNTYRDHQRVSRDTLRDIANQFHGWVKNRAHTWDVPILDAPEGRRDNFVEPYFRRAQPDEVVLILKAREPAGILIAIGNKQDDRWHLQFAQRWVVQYTVIMSAARGARCTCPDYETRGLDCKHVHAVRFVMEREQGANGETTVTKSVTVTETVHRTTYPQAWSAYNKAQTTEKDQFQILLVDLCRGITEAEAAPTGRPRLPLADVIFAATFKVYSTVSGRRFMSDLRQAHALGYTAKLPHYNSIFRYLEDVALTPLLRDLIVRSSRPLQAIECDFAADSTGFTTSRFHRWFDVKYGVVRFEHDWVKAHVMTGVKTNIVTAVEIHDRNASDTKQLPALLATTAKNFVVAEVSADKAYGSIKNINAISDLGAAPYIPFKSIHTGRGSHRKGAEDTGAWAKAFGYFMYRRDEFLAHYHQRSNVETTFPMIKRKFGDYLRSKTDAAMVNETMCKILAHNLVVLIHEMHELGIDPHAFGWDTVAPALELPA